jgi:hypothetical protein
MGMDRREPYGPFRRQVQSRTTAILAAPLWLYTVRFFDLNSQRSLLPCFGAQAPKNLGVLAVKYVQEFVGGRW